MHHIIRLFAVLFLFLSALAAFFSERDTKSFCLNGYTAPDELTYFSELNGVSANDPVAFMLIGMIAFLFSIILIFIKNKMAFGVVMLFCYLLIFLATGFIESSTFYQMIHDSILYCHNMMLIVWLVGLWFSFVFSLIYLKIK
ncbi:hypothetical protein QR665_12045 [Acinetobacter gerneri]|uniref:hypothetical protein n=1 Tax=Acinetobacter gerneri TaxID=202952 RepID=UPI002935DAEA|nr:hypothetical protein [Acinetobacter gerneri]MDV2440194.1 hypothetical protein [Acinetobacter gerneri]